MFKLLLLLLLGVLHLDFLSAAERITAAELSTAGDTDYLLCNEVLEPDEGEDVPSTTLPMGIEAAPPPPTLLLPADPTPPLIDPPFFPAMLEDAVNLYALYFFLFHLAEQINFDDVEGIIAARGPERHILRGLDYLSYVLRKGKTENYTPLLIVLALEAIHIFDHIAFIPAESTEEVSLITQQAALQNAFADPASLSREKMSVAETLLIAELTSSYLPNAYALGAPSLGTRPALLILLETCYKYLYKTLSTMPYFPTPHPDMDYSLIIDAYDRFRRRSAALRTALEAESKSNEEIMGEIQNLLGRMGLKPFAADRCLKTQWKHRKLLQALLDKGRYANIDTSFFTQTLATLQHYINSPVITHPKLYEEIVRRIGQAFIPRGLGHA